MAVILTEIQIRQQHQLFSGKLMLLPDGCLLLSLLAPTG
jgi:hypothetical protein